MFDTRRQVLLEQALECNEQEEQDLNNRLTFLALLQTHGRGHYGMVNEEVHRLLDMLVEQQTRLTHEVLTTVQQAAQHQRQQLAQFYQEVHMSRNSSTLPGKESEAWTVSRNS